MTLVPRYLKWGCHGYVKNLEPPGLPSMVAWQGDAKPGRVHQRGEIEGVSLILGHGVRFLVLGRES